MTLFKNWNIFKARIAHWKTSEFPQSTLRGTDFRHLPGVPGRNNSKMIWRPEIAFLCSSHSIGQDCSSVASPWRRLAHNRQNTLFQDRWIVQNRKTWRKTFANLTISDLHLSDSVHAPPWIPPHSFSSHSCSAWTHYYFLWKPSLSNGNSPRRPPRRKRFPLLHQHLIQLLHPHLLQRLLQHCWPQQKPLSQQLASMTMICGMMTQTTTTCGMMMLMTMIGRLLLEFVDAPEAITLSSLMHMGSSNKQMLDLGVGFSNIQIECICILIIWK